MAFNDLREFIEAADKLGECRVIEGANRESDIGTLTELQAELPNPPLLLFDNIEGYPRGYRVVSNLFASHRRTALALGFSGELMGLELARAFKNRLQEGVDLIPPVEVENGPVKENVHLGKDADLLEFPVPIWHEHDGGPYIGTGDCVITQDPDTGWVNFGAYRVQVHERNRATIHISPGHDGHIIAKKYWSKGKPCPVAVSCGQEPLLYSASGWERIPWGVPEYDFTGGLRHGPVTVTKGVYTHLPIPATAEIVLEGELMPPEKESRQEGPFGEAFGYYAGGINLEPVFHVEAVLHRNDPILQGNPPSRFPGVWTLGRHFQKGAVLWNELDKQMPGVVGVRMVEDASIHTMVIISLKQEYEGQAKQAALLAAGCRATTNLTFIIVVDDDIDPFNISQVLWALGTRVEPKDAVSVINGLYGVRSHPAMSPEKKAMGKLDQSVAIILACKPYYRLNEFPQAVTSSAELVAKTKMKFKHLFKDI